MNSETLNEGWVVFNRIYFAEGFIDRWHGDCINSPNNPTKNRMQLNASASYYRLNGIGDWINSKDLFKIGEHLSMTDLPAQMIWDNCYHDFQKIRKDQLNHPQP